jgi:hypothetical protein
LDIMAPSFFNNPWKYRNKAKTCQRDIG